MLKQLAQRYYAPGHVEISFYEKIGVRQFGRYVPTGGSRFSIVPSFFGRQSDRSSDLQPFVRLTLGIEAGHTLLAAAFLVLTGAILRAGFPFTAFVSLLINMSLNAYPIVLQRYNRWRALRALRAGTRM